MEHVYTISFAPDGFIYHNSIHVVAEDLMAATVKAAELFPGRKIKEVTTPAYELYFVRDGAAIPEVV